MAKAAAKGPAPRLAAPLISQRLQAVLAALAFTFVLLITVTFRSLYEERSARDAPAAAEEITRGWSATLSHPAGRMFGHRHRPAGNEVGSKLDQQLYALRAQLSQQVTQQTAQQALKGAKLPRGVSLAAAQQLLIDKQLLHHSLQDGHAAARAASIARYYASNNNSSASSRGILIVGGSRTHLGNAYILLQMLRHHLRCNLPVEVVYYGPQELDPAAATLVADFAAAQAAAGAPRITIVDGQAVHAAHLAPLQPHPEVPLTGWVAKVHALCWVTTFKQVLLLDSDNLPVQDPSALFDSPVFQQHGFVIWPDFWHNLWMKEAVYHLMGLQVPWEVDPSGLAAESGQLLFDRLAHHDVLEWLWLLNSHAGLVYRCVVGDKDTFKMAFQLAGKQQDYMQVKQPPQELLGDAGGSRNRFFHLGMGQASPDGTALMFLHRTARGKFFPWCAARGWRRGRCQPAWLSLPVVQEQLTVSVRDAGSMRFDASKIDTNWYKQHCTPAVPAVGNGSSNSSRWAMPLPVCSSYRVGQLPIVAVPAAALPGLPEYLSAVDGVFDAAAEVLAVQLVDRVKVFFGIL